MQKNIYLNIEDDAKKALKKIKLENSQNITLIVPKQALLFSDQANLDQLKKETEQLGKEVSIITMDSGNQKRARQAGFQIRNMAATRSTGHSMDVKSAKPLHHEVKHRAEAPRYSPPPQPFRPQTHSQQHVASVKAPEKPQGPVRIISPTHQSPHDVLGGPSETSLFRSPRSSAKASKNTRQASSLGIPRYSGKSIFTVFKILAIIGLVVLILLVTIILPQATIIVYARTQPVIRDFTLTIDRNAKSASVQQFLMPGQVFDSDQQFTKQFSASGQTNVGSQARGTLQIYNFTRQTFKLNANTTVFTVGTKTYHMVNDLVGLRPTAYIAGTKDPDPRTLVPQVEIVAENPGEDSNLPGGTLFELHNQVLGSLPQVLYAKNTTAITGGTSRFRTNISQQDIDTAKKSLAEELVSAARQKLETSSGLTILDSGTRMQIQNITFDKNAGDQALNFTGSITAHLTALAFDPSLLKSLVEQRINLTLDPDKYLVTGQKERITEIYRNADFNTGTGSLAVHFESLVASKIDTKGIASQINGKNALEIKELLLSNSNIDAVDINFKPFWVNSVPKFSGKVYVSSQLHIP